MKRNQASSRLAAPVILGWLGFGSWAVADWSLIEDFEGFSPGDSGGFSQIFGDPDIISVVSDPLVDGLGLGVTGGGGGGRLSGSDAPWVIAPEGGKGTLFFQAAAVATGSDLLFAFGRSGVTQYSSLSVLFRLPADLILEVHDGGYVNTGTSVELNTVHNFWVVIDNDTNRWDLYTSTGADAPQLVQDDISFRSTVSGNIDTIYLGTNSGSIYAIDNIYADSGSENLGFPPISALQPVAETDAVEVGVGGAIRFDPLANDTGSLDPASLEIIAAPTHGTATVSDGRMVYRHDGGVAATDSFSYRVGNLPGTAHAEAVVAVSIHDAMRLANSTLQVPAEPPSAATGTMVIEDALPGLTFPEAIAMTTIPGSPESLLVASTRGDIWYVPDSTAANPTRHLVLNLDSLTNETRGRSIYSLECFPDFATTGHIVVTYQGDATRLPQPTSSIPNLDKDGEPYSTITCDLRISRFTLSPAHLEGAMDGLSSGENADVLATEWPYLNLAEQDFFHSINDAKFGPDGYLYVSFGDEGDQGAPYRNTQTITKDQYSSVIRIDVDPASTNPKPNPHYAIAVGPLNGSHSPNTPFTDAAVQEPNFRVPADNPFVTPARGGSWDGFFNGIDHSAVLDQVRDEIWAVGLRNPFKIHIDQEEGSGETEVWVGDVGKNDREEFTVLKKGGNGGWAFYEGEILTPDLNYTPPEPAGSNPHAPPVFAYPHTSGNNSATGGIVYHGTRLASLTGRYLAGDFGSGRIWSISRDGSSVVELTGLRQSSNRIVDFHPDPITGDIFVLENNTWSGGALPRVLRITLQEVAQEDYPQTLSELGIFADLADFSPNPGVVPYEVNLRFWSDGADKSRWFSIPDLGDTMGYSRDGNWSFPEGMVWVKHFDFDLDRSQPGSQVKRLETRVLVRNAGGAYGVSYRWNEEGTGATLVPNEGQGFPIDYTEADGSPASLTWQIPARAECMTCHTESGGHALSMNTRQFNRPAALAGREGNLLGLLSDAGYLAGFADDPATLEKHHRPDETDIDIEARVRSYLDVNCAYCHQAGGSAPPSWNGRAHLSLAQTGLLYGALLSEGSPSLSDHLIRPGDKNHSALWNKINARGAINGTYNGYTQMPPLGSNVLDEEAIALIAEWIDHHANVAPVPASGSLAAAEVSENELVGYLLGTASAADPDVRDGVADQSQLRYRIAGGNEAGLFGIDESTGELEVNGILDYERQTQYLLTLEVDDGFEPNPGVTQHTVVIDLIDETAPDATADANGNGTFDVWEQTFGLGLDAAADTDGDGVRDFFEFLSGGDPQVADQPATLALSHRTGADGQRLAWNVRNGLALDEHYQVQLTDGLDVWTPLGAGQYEILSVTPVSAGVSRVEIRVPASGPRQFLRLSAP